MTPVNFPESNLTLKAGDNPDCLDLPTFRGDGHIISKWKLSWRERFKALFQGHIWTQIRTERTHAPILPSVDTPFEVVKD